MPLITFVDENDTVIGSGTKQEIWSKGIWHRIVRIYLINSDGELLITKRAEHLASCPGMWNDSASGHVDAGESYDEAANRELEEELHVKGITLKQVEKVKHADMEEIDKIKNRFHMIYVGRFDGSVDFDPNEVAESRWVTAEELNAWVQNRPSEFTEGFKVGFEVITKHKIFNSLSS